MANIRKHFFTVLFTTVLTFGLTMSFTSIFAWRGPGNNPPNGNVAEPINSGTGDQTKSGSLNINGNMAVAGTLQANSSLSIGNSICLRGSCITSWPTSSTATTPTTPTTQPSLRVTGIRDSFTSPNKCTYILSMTATSGSSETIKQCYGDAGNPVSNSLTLYGVGAADYGPIVGSRKITAKCLTSKNRYISCSITLLCNTSTTISKTCY